MATRPKKTQEKAVDDARTLAAVARNNLGGFTQYDKKKNITTIDKKFLVEYDQLHVSTRTAVGARSITQSRVSAATLATQMRREALYWAIASIREAVSLAEEKKKLAKKPGKSAKKGPGKTAAKAFASGVKLSAKSTEQLRKVAVDVENAYADDAFRADARAAGVTPKQIEEVAILRRDLTDAGTKKSTKLGEQKAATVRRSVLLHELVSHTAYIRKCAAVVFKQSPDTLSEFGIHARRGRPRKRAAAPAKPTSPDLPATAPKDPSDPKK